MAATIKPEPLEAAIEEYIAEFSADWRPKTLAKYHAEFDTFLHWLRAERRPLTTASLDFQTLLAYVAYLKAKPAVRGIWRGDREAVAKASTVNTRPRSLNSVGASMRSLRAFVLWFFEDGRIAANPFARKHRRGGQNPLIPRADTPTKSASLSDIEALERGVVRFECYNSKGRTYEVALQPETKAAILRYLHRGRPSLLPHYPVRGYEDASLGEDPGYLFLARFNGVSEAVGPLSQGALSNMLTRRYHAGGGRLRYFGPTASATAPRPCSRTTAWASTSSPATWATRPPR